jgi:hypothetical protein
MSILSNHYPHVLDELNGIPDPGRPELPPPTGAELNGMARLARPRKRSKPARTVRLMLAPHERSSGVIRLTVGKASADYFVRKIGSDFGDGFEVEKIGGEEAYQVNLSDEGHICTCKGHLRYGYCRHVSALVALRQRTLI